MRLLLAVLANAAGDILIRTKLSVGYGRKFTRIGANLDFFTEVHRLRTTFICGTPKMARIWILIFCVMIALGTGAYATDQSCSREDQNSPHTKGQCHCPKESPCKCSEVPMSLTCCNHSSSRGHGGAQLHVWKSLPYTSEMAFLQPGFISTDLTVDILEAAHPEHYGGNHLFLQTRSFRS